MILMLLTTIKMINVLMIMMMKKKKTVVMTVSVMMMQAGTSMPDSETLDLRPRASNVEQAQNIQHRSLSTKNPWPGNQTFCGDKRHYLQQSP